MTSGSQPRVLLLGDRDVVALPACRALGRAGYRVTVAASGKRPVAAASRYAAATVALPPLLGSLSTWRDALRHVLRSGAIDVVVASSDAGVAALLGCHWGVPTIPQLDARHIALIDKGMLAGLAESSRVTYPRTHLPRSVDNDAEVASIARGPTVIKASRSAAPAGDRLAVLPGATVVTDPIGASAAMAGIRSAGGQPILQELVAGRKLQAAVIRRAGVSSFRLAFEVERTFPREDGMECTARALDPKEGAGGAATAALERIADTAGFEGLLQAEFYWTQSGRVVLVDVNPRLWASVAFAELLGLHATTTAVRDAVGMQSIPPEHVPVAGRRYHHALREVRSVLTGESDAASVLRRIRRQDVWDLPDPLDPGPDLLRARLLVRAGVTRFFSLTNRRLLRSTNSAPNRARDDHLGM